nr:uncharacterized protein LOC121116245 [Lepeophtheirus salmonis]
MTSDLGRQFISEVWRYMRSNLGIENKCTTPYQPQSNGLVERAHRMSKEALRARLSENEENWIKTLNRILLDMRTTLSTDSGVSPAQEVYGEEIRSHSLPDVIEREKTSNNNFRTNHHSSYSQETSPEEKNLRLPKKAFIMSSPIGGPLDVPYETPFEILEKHDHYFILNRRGIPSKQPINRLKAAYVSI